MREELGRAAADPHADSAVPYEPGLGQICFGQPWREYRASDLLIAALQAVSGELERVLGNITQDRRGYSDPFSNSGRSFRCAGFTVCAYSWGDEGQPYNFKHPASGLQVSWYKWLGRGTSTNMPAPPDLVARVLDHCLKHLAAVEEGAAWDEPGLYPDGPVPDPDEETLNASNSVGGSEPNTSEAAQ